MSRKTLLAAALFAVAALAAAPQTASAQVYVSPSYYPSTSVVVGGGQGVVVSAPGVFVSVGRRYAAPAVYSPVAYAVPAPVYGPVYAPSYYYPTEPVVTTGYYAPTYTGGVAVTSVRVPRRFFRPGVVVIR